MLQQIDSEKGMRQRHAARGGLFQELAFLEPICSRDSRSFVLRNHAQIFCLRTRKRAHASAICTCRHALACPCKDERYVMSLPDLVLHTFSQKRKLVFLCFLCVIHQRHETPASAVQIGSSALKQMAETEAIRQASII